MQVHIEVLDENDNAPEFAKPYEPKVCENAAQGKVSLTQVGGQGSVRLGQAEGQHLPATVSRHFTKFNVTCTTALRKGDIIPTEGETEAQRECIVSRLAGRWW